MLFVDFFAANAGSATGVGREPPLTWAVVFGTVLYALALCLSLEKSKAPTNIVTGIVVGAVTGLLVWGTADFILLGVTNMSNLHAAIADSLLEGCRAAVTGAIVAIVGGFTSGKPAAA